MSHPAVSVLMSVYNAERYLRASVESVLGQTLCDWEFVVINDGSTDASQAILDAYGRCDARLRIISRARRGLTRSLNEGLALCRGTYIARMDADDVALPGRLEGQVAFLDAHPGHGCVGSAVIFIDAGGRKLFVRRMPERHEEICEAHLMAYGGMIVHSSAMLRRSVLDEVGGYDERFQHAQDYDLWCRMAAAGFRLANLNVPMLLYRTHALAVTQVCSAEQFGFVMQVLQRELDRRQIAEPLPLKAEYVMLLDDARWMSEVARRDGYGATAVRFAAARLKDAIREACQQRRLSLRDILGATACLGMSLCVLVRGLMRGWDRKCSHEWTGPHSGDMGSSGTGGKTKDSA